ncbi:Rho guanine nucleotide exchange factor [Marasmius crinis-equi]|uniref:Rho guanine nucleotide exchange factor n=1 Tax=Marasmius crinis-equi TaxID=585013 RepID=A0ABR3FT86_9AGAR
MSGPTTNYFPDASKFKVGDFANFSTVGGHQTTQHNKNNVRGPQTNNNNNGPGQQYNNNSSGMQNQNYGRDQNINGGTGDMTVNNSGRAWKNRSPAAPASPPAMQGNNNAQGMQNYNYGRDQNANGGPGAFNINNTEPDRRGLSRSSESSASSAAMEQDEPMIPTLAAEPNQHQASSDGPMSPEVLYGEEEAFRDLLQDENEYENVLQMKGEFAQGALDRWQQISENTLDTTLRASVLQAMIRLSDNSGQCPECLWIDHVQDLSKRPVEFGGFADIYTGKIGNTEVAVKVVRHRLPDNKQEQVSAFVREAMVWRQLDHPNILPFKGMYYFNEDEQQICLVSPWMENGNLLQYLKQNPNVNSARRQAWYNVLIDTDGTARITDFGLSKVVDAQQLHGLSAMSGREGPARWLAPELLKDGRKSANTLRSDIYAYGCIYAATIPFAGIEDYAVYHAVVVEGGHPDLPAKAPPNMRELMRSCWRKDPQSRPAASQLLELIARVQVPKSSGGTSKTGYMANYSKAPRRKV